MKLNINTDAVVSYTNKLEKLHRSALPVAIRGALNDTGLDVKRDTMPKRAANEFVNRAPNFFKANSKVDFAKGFDVNSMATTVGFVEGKLLNKSTNYAVKDLEEQEHGGRISSKTFIPTVYARTGKTKNGRVKASLRIKKIRPQIVEVKNISGKNAAEKYVKASIVAGVGGFVLYKGMLWRINSLTKKTKRGKAKIFRTPIYSVKQGRSVKVKPTGFMRTASLESNKKMEFFYIKNAKKQIKRLQK